MDRHENIIYGIHETAGIARKSEIKTIQQSKGNCELEAIEKVNRYSLLIQEFRKHILPKRSMRDFYDRYLINIQIIELFLRMFREKGCLYETGTVRLY